MKALVFLLLFWTAAASSKSCSKTIDQLCRTYSDNVCDAAYGSALTKMKLLNKYVGIHLSTSMQYLVMSGVFGTYKQSREGFEKLFRKLSDMAWNDALDIMKYITMRGGKLDLSDATLEIKTIPGLSAQEMKNLGLSVQLHKTLAREAHKIYTNVHNLDPEMSGYIKEKFLHKHAEIVRSLVGLHNDVKKLHTGDDSVNPGLNNFIVDEFLQKNISR